jgi:hypothetical protein
MYQLVSMSRVLHTASQIGTLAGRSARVGSQEGDAISHGGQSANIIALASGLSKNRVEFREFL